MVLDLLRLHGSSNVAVAEKGFTAVANLAYNNADNRRRLGEAGAATGELDISRSKKCLGTYFYGNSRPIGVCGCDYVCMS